MSTAVVEQVKQLIDELSVKEKVGLVEWLGATLGRELAATPVKRKKRSKAAQAARSAAPIVNGSATHAAETQSSGQERPWTEAEIRQLMKPEPKTGAEIAAWLRANPDTGEWGQKEIPDVVEWVSELRHKISKRPEWDE